MFTDPASLQTISEYDSVSESEDERRLPDVDLDDLAKRRFLIIKKSPVSPAASARLYMLHKDSPKSFSRESYPARPLAVLLEPMRSEMLVLDTNNYPTKIAISTKCNLASISNNF